jgi:hypothetical protein
LDEESFFFQMELKAVAWFHLSRLLELTRAAVAFIADFSQLSGPTLHVFGHASNTIELIGMKVIVANVRQAKNTNDERSKTWA